jgi:signal transduction histidine kinase
VKPLLSSRAARALLRPIAALCFVTAGLQVGQMLALRSLELQRVQAEVNGAMLAQEQQVAEAHAAAAYLAVVGLAVRDWSVLLQQRERTEQLDRAFTEDLAALRDGGRTVRVGGRSVRLDGVDDPAVRAHLAHALSEWTRVRRATLWTLRTREHGELRDNPDLEAVTAATTRVLDALGAASAAQAEAGATEARRIQALRFGVSAAVVALTVAAAIFVFRRILVPYDFSLAELVRHEAELTNARDELEAFSYAVAHDLRAPVRAILGYSQVLTLEWAGRLSPEVDALLVRIGGAAKRMTQLIDDLLSLSRVSRAEFHQERVDLGAMARAVHQELAARHGERRVELEVADELWVDGDPRFLHIVMENLLDNAWKYTRPREVAHITVGVSEVGDERAFYVRDDGVGFDMANAGRLFTPFERLHGQAEFEGTGVGLATVRRIIERHQGRVWAVGAVGKGATVYFTLGALRAAA